LKVSPISCYYFHITTIFTNNAASCSLPLYTLHEIMAVYYLIFIVQFSAICIHQSITVCVWHFCIASQWTDIWANRELSMLFHHPSTVLSAALLSWLEHCTPFSTNTGTSWPRNFLSLSCCFPLFIFKVRGRVHKLLLWWRKLNIPFLYHSNRYIKKEYLMALLEQTYIKQWHGLTIYKWQTWGKHGPNAFYKILHISLTLL
jgi:hypothetical protein